MCISNRRELVVFGQFNTLRLSVPSELYTIMVSIIRKIITSSAAPKPVGPYNQAILVDRTVYLSGVLGLDKKTGKLVDGGAVGEARQALINMGHILQASGSSFDKVVKTTILLDNIDDFAAINEVYKEFFTKDYPARSTFQVGKLPMGALIEIEAIALTGNVETVTVSSGETGESDHTR